MPAKGSDADFEHAIEVYVTGVSAEDAAQRFHVGVERLRDELIARGLWRSYRESRRLAAERNSVLQRERAGLPDAEIVARYLAGESENALAHAYGVSRSVVAARLRAAGVERRDMTTANRMIQARRSPEERKRGIMAAQAAQRGRKHTLEFRSKIALTRQLRRTHVSPAEELLTLWLRERLPECQIVPQYAIGPYNVDVGIVAERPIAVEIFGGAWHAQFKRRNPDRLRYLLDAGWNLIIIWVHIQRWPLSLAAADYVASFAQQASGDPAVGSQYRVIWGDGQEVPVESLNLDNLTLIPSRRAAKRARS